MRFKAAALVAGNKISAITLMTVNQIKNRSDIWSLRHERLFIAMND